MVSYHMLFRQITVRINNIYSLVLHLRINFIQFKATIEKNLILKAMNLITTKTNGCISFVEKNSSDENWLIIVNNRNCNSRVRIKFSEYHQKLNN